MIDLETFGGAPDGSIASIGAAAFNYGGGLVLGTFYVNTLASGRRLEERTVRWWLGQGQEAREALLKPKPVALKEGLNGLQQFIQAHRPKTVWANGVMFDLVILRDAYAMVRPDTQYVPWAYKQEMCLRPIREVGRLVGLAYSDFKGGSEKGYHNALDDALFQIEYLVTVLAKVQDGRT